MGKERSTLKHAVLLPHEIVGAIYDFGSGYFERLLTGGDEVPWRKNNLLGAVSILKPWY